MCRYHFLELFSGVSIVFFLTSFVKQNSMHDCFGSSHVIPHTWLTSTILHTLLHFIFLYIHILNFSLCKASLFFFYTNSFIPISQQWSMAFRDLDITSRFKKMGVYAVVSVSDAADNGSCRLEDKTEVDRAGDANPRWNTGFRFNLDEPALQANRLTLLFNLLAGDKDVAELSLPVKTLLDHPFAAGEALSLAYDLHKPGGKPKGAGQLTFSFKFGEKPAPRPRRRRMSLGWSKKGRKW